VSQVKNAFPQMCGPMLSSLLVLGLLIAGAIPSLSQDRQKPEIIQATARGTSTQAGKLIQVRLIINDYSTDEDRRILIEAFDKARIKGWSMRWRK